MGKTEWARCLGPHAYVATSWDLTAFDQPYQYVVFDDVPWEPFERYAKAFMGAQRDFSVSDKYRKKKRLSGGVPCIYLLNPEDFTPSCQAFVHSAWGRENVDVIEIFNKLF